MPTPVDIDRLIEKAVRRGWLIDTGTGAYAVTRAAKRRAWFFSLARKASRLCRAFGARILARRRAQPPEHPL
jgi:hypothetical protein